uniref:Uncharacterized protein n=1 Tax=Schizaphis graminum TaxID=13262 RepID=A0A2S2NY36_SCHGA
MSAALLCSTRHKQALSLKCKQNPNNLKLALHYKKYKNNYTNILRLSKEKFYEKKFKSVSHNPKLTWQLINEVTGSITKCKDKFETIISNDKVYNANIEPKVVSDIFNKFFIDIGKQLAENSGKVLNKEFSNVSHNFSFDNLFNKKIENSDILKIVDNFKDDTVVGFDRVTIKILKNIIDLIINPLSYIPTFIT